MKQDVALVTAKDFQSVTAEIEPAGKVAYIKKLRSEGINLLR
ncbi:MAG: hypothetical protein ACI82A_002031 [Candidatus Azotimanducaceae bacterium]|jgi:hypothetical protein